MRLYVEVNGEHLRFFGNMARVFERLDEAVKGKKGVRLLTVFYDSKKEKRRFKRELREARGNLVKAARRYLNWWRQIQARHRRRSGKEGTVNGG